ncbi:MAG: glycosyltransferase family 4 protein, partial [Deltaproteobacteria bacterium]|nr:glycosyltransferase family 4 protein [Nannocystaceae bacterium]
MKILYLHQYFVPADSPGGTRSYEFARRLARRGHEVTVVTSCAAMQPEFADPTRVTHREIDGIKLVILPVPYSNEMSFAQRLGAFGRFAAHATLETLRKRADVIFATSTPLTIAIPGLLGRYARNTPMVFEVRDLWPELPIAIGALENPMARTAARAREWAAYHGSSEIVALSPGMADGVGATGIPRERITVIPNSCDIDAFTTTPETIEAFRRARLPELRADQPLVVYGGTFGRINDAGWLVDVAAAMTQIAPDVRFAYAGGGAEADKIRARASAAGVLGRSLWMLPPLPKREMPAFLGCASVATSLFMPLPEMENNSANKFFDALAAGKPVAINYRGWQAELLQR